MNNLQMIDKAREFATRWHRGQVRKYTKLPYITHCEAVYKLVRTVPNVTAQMLVAAWLHDVVEDCAVTVQNICDNFGPDVARLVEALTDIYTAGSGGNRKARKQREAERLATFGWDVQTIKLADIIDNTSTIVDYDPDFAAVYLEEKDQLIALLTRGDKTLREIAKTATMQKDYL